jgi:hypothetical protein
MKKSDLKQLIKPVVKECIHEVLLEEGLLSNVVSEVVKGMNTAPLVESRQNAPRQQEVAKESAAARKKMTDHRKRILEAIGTDAYNGIDLFEGTEPLSHHEPQAGSADLGSPRDAGVDISSIVGDASKIWQAIK